VREARFAFLGIQQGEHTWARETVYRYLKTRQLAEMGFTIPLPDWFTFDCFCIIQGELDRQTKLREKHG